MPFSLSSLFESLRDSFHKRPVIARFLVGLILLSIAVPSFRIARASGPANLFSPTSRSDFEDYHTASVFLREGKDPYRTQTIEDLQGLKFNQRDLFNPKKLQQLVQKVRGVGTYLYPPFWAFLLFPLSFLSYGAAAAVFQTLSLLSLILFLYLIPWMLGLKGISFFREVMLLLPVSWSLLLLYRFILENGTNGNIAFFLILMIGVGLRLAWEHRTLLAVAGGFLIGLATAIKVTPVYLGLVLLAGRKYRAIGGAILGGIFAILIPSMELGLQKNLELFENWRGLIIEKYGETVIVRPWANNQSFSGAAGKLLIPGSDMKQERVGLPLFQSVFSTRADYVGVASAVRVVNLGVAAAALFLSLLLLWKGSLSVPVKGSPYRNITFLYFLGFILFVSLLTSGVSWYHSYSILLIPLVFRIALRYLDDAAFSGSEKAMIAGVGLFGIGTLLLPSRVEDAIALYSIFTFLATWMMVHLAVLSIRTGEAG